MKTDMNYEFVMKYLISHFSLPKSLQRQKRYLRKGLYKPCNTNIRYFICQIDYMVGYLKKFPPFGAGQRLPEDEILELVYFSLPKKWQKYLIIQGFGSSIQGSTDLVEFCERLETSEEIFQTQGEGNQQNKKTSILMNSTNPPSQIRANIHTRLLTPWKKMQTKREKKKILPVCPIPVLGHDMNLCKVMLSQSKAMNSTW